MNEATIGRLYNLTDPYKPLEWNNPINVDIDAVEDEEGSRVRGDAWATDFATRIRRKDEPVLELFTGLPGSGKSTELRRLAHLLEKGSAGTRHLPVLIDADDAIDTHAELDISFLLAVIVHHAEKRVLQAEGRNPQEALTDGYWKRFTTWLTQTDIEFNKGTFTLAEGVSVEAEMRTRPALREKIRQIVGAHLTRFLEDVHEELRKLDVRSRARGFAGLVVIFDSLEKLSGTSATSERVLASAENVFVGSRQFLRLPVHCIFTVPPSLLLTIPLGEVRFMPMIKLKTRDGVNYEPGRQMARELVRRRIPDAELAALLGPEAERLLNRIIEASGGFPRDILRPLHSLLERTRFPVAERDLDRVQNRQRDAIGHTLLAATAEWLARVATTKSLSLDDLAARSVAVQALKTGVVMRYLNDADWFDVHPLVLQIEGVSEALKRLRTTKPAA